MHLDRILKEYGLKEKQAKVYLACLELGSGSVLDISRKAQVPRSTCEVTLKNLHQQGWVYSFKKKSIIHFGAEDPHRIIHLAKQKAELLSQSLPQFIAAYGENKTQPTTRFYQGKEGMRLILEEILKEAQELCCFASADDLFQTLNASFPEFAARRAAHKIPLRVILKDSPLARKRLQTGPRELRQVRLLTNADEFHGLIYRWKNKVALFSFGKDLEAAVIESPAICTMQKVLFQSLWDKLK